MKTETTILPNKDWSIDFFLPTDQDIQAVELRRFDDTLDNIYGLLHDVCAELQKAGARFTVSSPEVGDWVVDVKTDFCVFIEQVPNLLKFLNSPNNESFELHFYEQGCVAAIEFEKVDKKLTVTCSRLEESSPSARVERTIVEKSVWRQMILRVWENYCEAVHLTSPCAMEHPYWMLWVGDVKD